MEEYLSKAAAAAANDSWSNVATGMGQLGTDKRMSNVLCRRVLTEYELDEAYHGDDIMRRACDIVPEEMTRERADFPTDKTGWLQGRLAALGVWEKLCDALVWERQAGGSAIYLGAFDGNPVTAPLDEKKIERIDGMRVYDRFELQATRWYDDPRHPKYGEPSHYRIVQMGHAPLVNANSAAAAALLEIHESRFIIFNGMRTKRRMRWLDYQGWGVPLPEIIFDVVRDFTTSYAHAATIVTDFSQAVYTINGLAAMLNADLDGQVIKRLKLLDFTRSMSRAVVLDETETFERKGTPVSGLEELLDHLGLRLAAAVNVPLTLLLGMSPGGLNATGDSDHRNFYNTIKAQQTTRLAPALARVCRLLVAAGGKRKILDANGEVPFTFRSLWQPSDLEVAQAHLAQATADAAMVTAGILHVEEIRDSRFGAGRYSFDTVAEGPPPEPPAPPAPAPAPAAGGNTSNPAPKKPKQ